MAYKSKYKPVNPSKCINSQRKEPLQCRSLWERSFAKWCDNNPNVVRWGIETVVIPYVCRTDNMRHRYFVDFYLELSNGNTVLIEIKPDEQTKEPSRDGKTKRRLLKEVLTYSKNISKWEAAREYANERGWMFEVWTEKHLKTMGIKIVK